MVKNIGISTITVYQIFVSPMLKNLLGVNAMCRFDETCSHYTKRMIKEEGVIKGTLLGAARFLKCQPISS